MTSEVDCPLLDCDLLIGLCLGSLLDYSHEETKAQCFKLCQNSPNCHWYSYNSKDKTCLQFNDCPTINEKFEDYVSSSTNCDNFKLLVVTGIDTSQDDFLSSSEVIDLSDSEICQDLGNYPMKIAGTVFENHPKCRI